MARLASGNRINSAADDSAGLAIASRLTAEARGLDMATRNAADAQAMINTVESSHNEISNILQRMRELAVQGASDTNGTADRTNIRTELNQLVSEIDAIKDQTLWAGQALISSAQTFTYQTGDAASENITVATTLVSASALSVSATSTLTSAANFSSYIGTVNSAIATIATYRATYGAVSNRLDHTMANLATNSEAVKASLGRIKTRILPRDDKPCKGSDTATSSYVYARAGQCFKADHSIAASRLTLKPGWPISWAIQFISC